MIQQSFLEAINQKCACLEAGLEEIEERLDQIEAEGYTSAHLITRGNGYKGKHNYYLSHSTRSDWVASGKPRFEYVGTKPEKIASAQARIDRYEEKRALETERLQVRHTLEQVKYYLARIVSQLFDGDAYRAYLADPESLAVIANGNSA
jgi:hypothetical protein